jgi:Uri superfamily endonuclease
MTSNTLIKSPGAYALELYLAQPREIAIGRLGRYYFDKGQYIYLGSANGPGGINARLGRHISGSTLSLHWHIDYLRNHAHPIAFCFISTNGDKPNGKPIECCWSQALMVHPKAYIPIPGFGASDCTSGCKAHLFFYPHPGSEKSEIHPIVLKQASVLHTLAHAIGASVVELIEHTSLIRSELVVHFH